MKISPCKRGVILSEVEGPAVAFSDANSPRPGVPQISRFWRFGIARTRLISLAYLFTSAVLFAADTPSPQVVAITGGKLLTVSHGTIENGTILLADGKIAAIGTAADVKIPKGAEIVDAKGLTVYPGLIDPETT